MIHMYNLFKEQVYSVPMAVFIKFNYISRIFESGFTNLYHIYIYILNECSSISKLLSSISVVLVTDGEN